MDHEALIEKHFELVAAVTNVETQIERLLSLVEKHEHDISEIKKTQLENSVRDKMKRIWVKILCSIIMALLCGGILEFLLDHGTKLVK